MGLGATILIAAVVSFRQQGDLFFQSYRVDLFSQVFKILTPSD